MAPQHEHPLNWAAQTPGWPPQGDPVSGCLVSSENSEALTMQGQHSQMNPKAGSEAEMAPQNAAGLLSLLLSSYHSFPRFTVCLAPVGLRFHPLSGLNCIESYLFVYLVNLKTTYVIITNYICIYNMCIYPYVHMCVYVYIVLKATYCLI